MKQTQNKENLKISKKENPDGKVQDLAKENTLRTNNRSENIAHWGNRRKCIFYTAIFCFLCVCDQRRGSAPGHTQLMFVNLSWAAVLLLQFTAIQFRELVKIPYALFTGLCIAGTLVSGFYRRGDLFFERFFVGQWYAGCLVVWLIGILLMHGIGESITGKYREQTKGNPYFLNSLFFLAMIVAYVLNKDLWPVVMVMVFGELYYRKRSEEDKECLLNNLSNGIILGFFLIQGQAFVFRPFDTLRYNGMYANPNMNGLFYMLVYCACLSKYCYYYTKREEAKESKAESGKRINKATWIRWFYLFLGASLWAFTLFTQCRSALMGMAAATTVAGIYCLVMRRTHVIKNGVCMVAGLLLCIAITLPISYLAVRYLPPFFHHPIWFEGEYSEEKVHSWDPYDSPKFTNYQQIIESFTGRLHDASGQSVVVEILAPIGGAEEVQMDAVQEVQTDVAQDTPTPVFDYEEENSLKIRKAIYSHYLSKLGFMGHKEEENGLQITPNYFAPHAHNLFLQIAFSFGIITGVLFLVWVLLSLAVLAKQAFKERKRIDPFLFELAIVLFGVMEIMWRTGQLSLTLLFILPMFVNAKHKKTK